MPDDKLPSINDWDDSKELPSVEDFLKEEVEEELPSVEDYIEEEEVKEEDTVTIEDANGDPFLEVTDVVKAPEWSELVRMVNDVRESIPDIPEIKYYDEELKQLAEHIEQVSENIPEVKDYDPDYNYTLKNGKAIKGEKIVIDHTAIEAEIAKTQYRQDRSYLYPPIGDQLDDLYKNGAFSDDMTAKIKAVKDANPKPS